MNTDIVFKSAVDWWFYTIILLSIGLIGSSALAIPTGITTAALILIVSGAMALGLPVWLLFSTRYTITDDLLIVQSGPFKWQIPRAEIHSISRTASLASAPALSLKRLDINYAKQQHLLVSPKNADAFAEALGFE